MTYRLLHRYSWGMDKQFISHYLVTLLPCWIFRHHCGKAMLVAQPPLLKGLCPLGTSTSESGWAQAKRATSRRLLVSAFLWDVYPGIWGSSGTVHRNLSSVCLNWSTEQPVVFLTSAGRALNSLVRQGWHLWASAIGMELSLTLWGWCIPYPSWGVTGQLLYSSPHRHIWC